MKPEKNERFVDRPEVFEALDLAIKARKSGDMCKPVTICGLGGMGKSQVAIEFCYRSKKNNKYRYIFWMEADTEAALQSTFTTAAGMLGLTAAGSDVVPSMIQWLHSNDGWLLVFDNADDFSLGNSSEPRRLQNVYFPKMGHGTILLTTRIHVADQNMKAVDLNVMKMDDETALKLLLRDNVTDDPNARKIVEELGYLPLAIDIAGALMVEDNITPSEYLESYKKDTGFYLRFDDMLEQASAASRKTVWTVWNISIARIKVKDPLAADLLRSIVLLHPDNIPSVFFQRHSKAILGTDDHPLKTSVNLALKRLRDFSLIHRTILKEASDEDPAKDIFAIHRLVQTVIRFNMEPTEKQQRFERLISAMSCEMPSDLRPDEQFRTTMDIYVPHIQHLYQQLTGWTNCCPSLTEITSLLLPTVIYLVRQALFEDSEDLAKLAVSNSEETNSLDHLDTAAALSVLFYHYAMKRDFDTAQPHGERALEIRKESLGLNDDKTRSSLHYLAFAYDASGKRAQAKSLYEEAANANDRVAMLQLARIHLEMRDYGAARALETKLDDPSAPKLQRDFYEYGRIDLTPLHYAVLQNDVDAIEKRAEEYERFVNVGDEDGRTPLHHAAKIGFMDVVKLLVEKLQAPTETKDKNNSTPLHSAVLNGHVEIAVFMNKEPLQSLNFRGGVSGSLAEVLSCNELQLTVLHCSKPHRHTNTSG